MEESTVHIPPSILAKLLELKETLTRQGTVQLHHGAHRRITFRLRYRIRPTEGQRVQRSLELGSEQIAFAVQGLLKEWRASAPKPQSSKVVQSDAERQDRALKKYFRQQAKAAGGGRSFQTKVGKMYDAAMKGSARDAFRFFYNEPYLTPPKRGRPRKSRLW